MPHVSVQVYGNGIQCLLTKPTLCVKSTMYVGAPTSSCVPSRLQLLTDCYHIHRLFFHIKCLYSTVDLLISRIIESLRMQDVRKLRKKHQYQSSMLRVRLFSTSKDWGGICPRVVIYSRLKPDVYWKICYLMAYIYMISYI